MAKCRISLATQALRRLDRSFAHRAGKIDSIVKVCVKSQASHRRYNGGDDIGVGSPGRGHETGNAEIHSRQHFEMVGNSRRCVASGLNGRKSRDVSNLGELIADGWHGDLQWVRDVLRRG